MRVLGLDFGSKRIGLAISDGLGITAQPLDTITPDKLHTLNELIKEYEVEELVVGLPLNMNGSKGPKAEEAIAFVEELKKTISVPIKMWDERLTTMAVEKELIRADVSRKKRKRSIDKLAAQLILQGYLDAQRAKNA